MQIEEFNQGSSNVELVESEREREFNFIGRCLGALLLIGAVVLGLPALYLGEGAVATAADGACVFFGGAFLLQATWQLAKSAQ